MTRPNIAFVLSIVSRYYNNLDFIHIAAVTWIWQYIKGSLNEGIIFQKQPNTDFDLIGSIDVDYELAKEDWKSTSKWLFCFGKGLIS